jgi:hypothetical protein
VSALSFLNQCFVLATKTSTKMSDTLTKIVETPIQMANTTFQKSNASETPQEPSV